LAVLWLGVGGLRIAEAFSSISAPNGANLPKLDSAPAESTKPTDKGWLRKTPPVSDVDPSHRALVYCS
ncbi:MAG: hypothetical protein ACR2HJ_04935, partial [Fimbriimonadales bacterium]